MQLLLKGKYGRLAPIPILFVAVVSCGAFFFSGIFMFETNIIGAAVVFYKSTTLALPLSADLISLTLNKRESLMDKSQKEE